MAQIPTGCGDAKYSVRFFTDLLYFGDSKQNRYTPGCAAFSVYNGTNTTVEFMQIPFAPGGTACFDEMIDGCYDQEIEYSFVNPAHTGQFYVIKQVKIKR